MADNRDVATQAGSSAEVGPEGSTATKTYHRDGWLKLLAANVNIKIGALLIIPLILFALFAPLLAPYDPLDVNAIMANTGPSFEHWLGTDEFGRDILSRIIYGSRASLSVAVGAVIISALIGVPLGLVAGYRGGWLEALIMRVLDAVLAFPLILLAILIMSALGTNTLTLMGTIGFLYIPYFGRLVRASTLSLKHEDFVLASVASGSPTRRILLVAFLPNIAAPVLVQITLALGISLLIEAGLSYLGLGIQPPTPAWGSMLRTAQGYMYIAPWYVLAPGLTICVAVLGFNLMSDGFRDVLDPHMRQ